MQGLVSKPKGSFRGRRPKNAMWIDVIELKLESIVYNKNKSLSLHNRYITRVYSMYSTSYADLHLATLVKLRKTGFKKMYFT